MVSQFRRAGFAGICALGLGVGVVPQAAVAQTNAEGQGQLKIGERAGKFELSGSGLSLRATGKARKQLGAADSNPLALPSQKLTPSQGQTDAFAVVD